jgi:hypothetical protein
MQEREGDAPGVGMHVEGLVRQQTAQRARGHVANGVVAGFARGQALVRQQVKQIGHICQRDEMIL